MTLTYACRCVTSIPRRLRQLGDHRVTAKRAARSRGQCPWPGRRPGRREAESIDDGEHGASIIGAMVDRRDDVPSRDAVVRRQLGLTTGTNAARPFGTIRAHMRTRGTPAPDGVNDPLATPGGQPLGTVVGSFTPSSLLRHRQPQGFTRRQTAPPRLDIRANSRDIKRLRGSHGHGRPGGSEGSVRAPKQGGQPDAVFAWLPSWPMDRTPK